MDEGGQVLPGRERDNLPKLLSRNQAGETYGKAKTLFVIHEQGKVIKDSKWVMSYLRIQK